MLFEEMVNRDYEQVVFCHDKSSGLKAIIAIHDTTLGPALGGCRMWPYATEEEALVDALRLARGMTYKNAAAGLNIGGAKTVIIGDPKKDKSEALFRALGRYIEGLNGRYITAEDVNTTVEDMNYIFEETNYVTGSSSAKGGSGNPSPKTALGVLYAMKATASEVYGSDSLEGKTISIQGVGNVSYSLCEMLHEEGAKLIVTDINQAAVKLAVDNFGATAVGVDEIYSVDADIFCPCALGGILNDETIPQLKVKAVCGSANNQLLDIEKHGKLIEKAGIVYAPDYIVNSGGVINVAQELSGYDEGKANQKIMDVYNQMKKVFEIAKRENITTAMAADHLAEERIEEMMRVRSTYIQTEKSSITKR
ncbi:Glu/Leu/Phe/Val dehydrogenase dimerization domain-containing protein [Vagococcus zengguangii]|uniref:Glu/Leu/Phe/Val dehydrogenase n=1 Tax=Vagococcus zengguangii TaxID=2571750 RepID=A0A4D7CWJ5_9ENTE|nr:Glu/Leu/Phe/Val dehydrogenase dimerization domain-containing protein [Vagococcus zengguangii]QCI86671.1 Glu/Leu/Phe/Val dehydrogenase [Vagococcus zengguangii]TLG78291.1 Glu/Leu/Phe/Val dehydrogenase [Vagococcus zengguangii]